MFDYFIGLFLLGLGLNSQPTHILGKETAAAIQLGTARAALLPKLTPEQLDAFQTERAKREENLRRITEARIHQRNNEFAVKQNERLEKDKAARTMLESKAMTFKDAVKKQRLIVFSYKYQTSVTTRLTVMQHKLESMSALLDRILAASGALKTQGRDISLIESRISTAEAKVVSAISLVTMLAGSVPTSISVASEESAKDDAMNAIQIYASQMEPARIAFTEAYDAVTIALVGIEEITNATQEGPK